MKLASLIAGLICSVSTLTWSADTAPSNATGQCKDGSYTTAASHRGACADHGGVKSWFADKDAAATTRDPATAAQPKTTDTTAAASSSPPKTQTAAAGQVWVNTKSHVYHCSGDRWYGKTKHGEYMSETDAKAKGNRADHNKSCNA